MLSGSTEDTAAAKATSSASAMIKSPYHGAIGGGAGGGVASKSPHRPQYPQEGIFSSPAMTIPSLGVDSPYLTHGTPGGDSRVTSSLVNLTPEHTAILSDSILRKVISHSLCIEGRHFHFLMRMSYTPFLLFL